MGACVCVRAGDDAGEVEKDADELPCEEDAEKEDEDEGLDDEEGGESTGKEGDALRRRFAMSPSRIVFNAS